LLGRFIANPRVPPVGLAVVGGAVAIALTGTVGAQPVEWAPPSIVLPQMTFSLSAVVAITLPMVVLAMGLGNVQGLGFLSAQGYTVPVNAISTVVGVNSLVNAFFGGHPATVARTGVAILASSEAGPKSTRYWAAVIAAALTIIMALAATPVASLLNLLPKTYIFALAGLAILASLQDALEKAFGGSMPFGALVALVVAMTPFAVFGITSAFWAIIAGLIAALLVERRQLIEFCNEGDISP
jgi:benzoate membrane transport protein